MQVLGQPSIKLLSSDNPANDVDFFQREIPSLASAQKMLDTVAPPAVGPVSEPSVLRKVHTK